MIGVALIKKLLSNGHEVVAIARHWSKQLTALVCSGKIEFVRSDMSEYSSIADHISNKIDIAVLMAWSGTRGADRNDREMQRKNYGQNMALLPELCKLGCKKIVTAGSQAEYGSWLSSVKLKETDAANPNTEYGIEKLHFYQDCSTFCKEAQITVVEPRFFSLYGPEDYQGTLIISMLQNMLQNRPCMMTECIQSWDYLYIDDAITALELLITEDRASGIYNLGSGSSFMLKEYVEIMYRVTNSKSELIFGAIPYPATGMVNLNPDVNKLIGLGWMPKVSFEEGVKKVVQRIQNYR